MLRRYLITNGITTVVLYAAVWAWVPSPSSISEAISNSFDSYVMGHTFLGPVLNRVISVGAEVIGLL